MLESIGSPTAKGSTMVTTGDSIVQPYEVVAARLRRAIHLGIYPPGTNMPPEREHSELLGVSRSTLRGALRILVGEGLVEVRRGATGGVFVLENEEPVDVLKARLRQRADELRAVMDFRVLTETFAAQRAAENSTENDIAEIAASIEEMAASNTTGELRRADMHFHLAIAAAARSKMLLTAIEDARAALFLPFQVVDFSEMLSHSAVEHQNILDRIAAGDAEGAAAQMESHLSTTRDRLERLLEP